MVGTILGIVAMVMKFFVDRAGLSREAQTRFYAFVESLGEKNLVSVKMLQSCRDQMEKLKKGDSENG